MIRQEKNALLLALAVAACRSTGPEALEVSAEAAPAPKAVEPQQGGDGSGQLAQDAQVLDLAQQRKAFLVASHIDNAKALMGRLDLEGALAAVDEAIKLDGDNLSARDLRAQILALRGDKIAVNQTVAQDMEAAYALRMQQIKTEVQDSLSKANLHVARGDYQAAVAELEIARNAVRYAPYSVKWDGLDQQVEATLAKVKEQRTQAEKAAQETAERKATEALRAEEAAARERKLAVLNNILDSAIAAFDAGDYEEAEDLADQALLEDPRNEQAKEIRDSAFRAGRTKVRAEYVEAKREQFRRWREQMKEIQIPYVDVITQPSAKAWNEMSERRSKRQGLDLSTKVEEGDLALREQLKQTTVQIPPIADEESLAKVIDTLRLVSGLPLVVDPAAEAAASEAGTTFTLKLENKLTAHQALNLITQMAGENVTWTTRHEAVLVTTKEKARTKPFLYNHDVQDLVFGLTDFLGPRIDQLRLIENMSDDDGGGPFGAVGEKPKILEPADLATLIQENIAKGSWSDEGISIEASDGYILVNHTAEVQQQVVNFLNDLRRFSTSLVTIESKFLTVSNNWIQELGVDFRGLDNVEVSDVTNGLEDQASKGLDNGGSGTAGQNAAGHPSAGVFYDDGADGDYRATTQNFFESQLGNALSTVGGMTFQWSYLNDVNLSALMRAVEKSSEVQLVNDQVVSVHNTQRAYVTAINQKAYIQDFDVEVAQFQAVADPVVNVLNEGVVLDVRPTIHQNRQYLTLEIQPTVAKVVALRDFSSTLGGNTSPIKFQLPELKVESVFTSAVLPDGGSLMLGGLSSVRNIERRAEVPWIAKIPVVGFFFKNEGYSDENRSLMILIRARITDVRDEMRKLEAR
jgi:type II secretory pathway component GspD/PulD (secretin)